MTSLKLAVALAIGLGAATSAAAGPPSCSGCPQAKTKTAVTKEGVTNAGYKLLAGIADFTSGAAKACGLQTCAAETECPSGQCPAAACSQTACSKTACSETACTASACNKTACSDAACSKTAASCPTAACPASCTGPGSACCEKMGCSKTTAVVAAPAPTGDPAATCDAAAPSTAVVICSASSDSTPPSPARTLACHGEAAASSVCPAATETVTDVCLTCNGLNATICKTFTVTATPTKGLSATQCAAECLKACGTACRGAKCDGGPCPDGVCESDPFETNVCRTAPAETTDLPLPTGLPIPCEPTPIPTGVAALAAPYPIAYDPPGLYGVQRTAAVETGYAVTPAGYAAPPVAPAPKSGLPVGCWTRTLNDQSVTIAVAANGSFTATCTVPQAGCSLKIGGDCNATADGLLFGVVTSAKICPRGSKGVDSVDPMACVEVEAFCRSLIDQPFSARCRVTGLAAGEPTLTVSNALFGGIGFVGTPVPGDPAHLALTMFSGAYEAE